MHVTHRRWLGHGRTAEGTGTGRFGAPGVDSVLDDVRALQLVTADQHLPARV